MRKVKNTILDLCYLYTIYVFFYGIVIKFTINSPVLFELKTIVPELILVAIIFITVFIGEFRLSYDTVLLCFWMLAVFLINLVLHGITLQFLYLIRDIYVPVLLYVVLQGINFSEDQIRKFSQRIYRLSCVYLISGLILIIIEQIMGWEWTAKFYTGYSFYNQDPVSKIKIAHNLGLLRAPGWCGNFAQFGYYCLICYCMILGSPRKNRTTMVEKIELLFWFGVTSACVILCTNKTAIVALLVLTIYKISYNQVKSTTSKSRITLASVAGCMGLAVLIYLFLETDFYKGLFLRIGVWQELFANTSLWEIFFPYNQVLYGSGIEGELSFWDNTYFYSLFAIGAIGLGLICTIFQNTIKRQLMIHKRDYVGSLTVILILLSIVANVTQGRGFLTFYFLFTAVGCNRFSSVGNTGPLKRKHRLEK